MRTKHHSQGLVSSVGSTGTRMKSPFVKLRLQKAWHYNAISRAPNEARSVVRLIEQIARIGVTNGVWHNVGGGAGFKESILSQYRAPQKGFIVGVFSSVMLDNAFPPFAMYVLVLCFPRRRSSMMLVQICQEFCIRSRPVLALCSSFLHQAPRLVLLVVGSWSDLLPLALLALSKISQSLSRIRSVLCFPLQMSALAPCAGGGIVHYDSVFHLVVYQGIPWRRRNVGAVVSPKHFASKPIVPCLVMPVRVEMSLASNSFVLVC